MVCGICGQAGHNRRTCPIITSAAASTAVAFAESLSLNPSLALTPIASRKARRRWRKSYRAIRRMRRFINYSYECIGPPPPTPDGEWVGFVAIEDIRIIYPTWLKMRKAFANDDWFTPKIIEMLW